MNTVFLIYLVLLQFPSAIFSNFNCMSLSQLLSDLSLHISYFMLLK